MEIAARRTSDGGIRKAAILVAGLDRRSADLLLERLDAGQADRIRRAVVELDDIGEEERRRVIDEFRRIRPLVPGCSPPGIELTGLPPRRELAAVPAGASVEDGPPPFHFLHEAEDKNLLHLLAGERPRTIALVLTHLPPERAAYVLDGLEPVLQVEVVRRLADLENTDPETLREIEGALESRLSRLFDIERRRTAGPQSVARILANCKAPVRRRILDNVAVEDQPLAERFGRRQPDFDDICRRDDAVLSEVLRTAGPDAVRAALLGAPPAQIERLLHCMPPKEAKETRRRLACPGPIRLQDVEDAQREIAELAEYLACGKLNKTAA